MPKTHRIAIIGIGAIANLHARAISDLEKQGRAKLVAGSCRTREKGEKFASRFHCQWYDDYEKMLDAQKPDLVTICTPSGLHLEPMVAAAKRGVHVLCEKPLEITTARIDQMTQAARQAGVTLGGIFPQRFNPVVRAVYDAAKAGRFGNLAIASAYVPWWRDDPYYAPQRWQGKLKYDGGGALMNQSIHGIDMLQWIAGAAGSGPVEQVFAFTAQRGHDPKLIEVEDAAVAVLRFRGGALGQILGATSMYPGTFKRFQIGGRDGTAEILEDELTCFQFRQARPDDDQARQRFGAKTKTGGGAGDPMAIDYTGHTRNIAGFLDALDGQSPLALDAAESRKAVAIIEAIYASARTGQPASVRG